MTPSQKHASIFAILTLFFGLQTGHADDSQTAFFSGHGESVTHRTLDQLQKKRSPWLEFVAHSDQRQPLYLGASPLDLEFHANEKRAARDTASLLNAMKDRLKSQAHSVFRAIQPQAAIEFEAWPALDDSGQYTWVFARYRPSPNAAWVWIEDLSFPTEVKTGKSISEPAPIFPIRKKLDSPSDFSDVFDDFLLLKSLYRKPLFGDAIFTDSTGQRVLAAWPKIEKRQAVADAAKKDPKISKKVRAWILPQPPYLNHNPISFIVKVSASEVRIPENIRWIQPDAFADRTKTETAATQSKISKWPDDFAGAYEKDVRVFSGVEEAVLAKKKTKARFLKKSTASPDHDLETLVDYLEDRYTELGIRTERQRFTWRNIKQSNLIAKISGSLPDAGKHPVILADHIDTAFCEDLFDSKNQRISTSGADDNVTAVAALLRAASVLKNFKPKRDIWLVHLTGEEFPADGLGSRHFLKTLFAKRIEPHAVLLLDMIGWNPKGNSLFQINAGTSRRSIETAEIAFDSARSLSLATKPALRERFSQNSYLYNTDGIIYENLGLPIVLFNERLSLAENFDRPHYHQSTDTIEHIDFAYAISIVKTAIETAARVSSN